MLDVRYFPRLDTSSLIKNGLSLKLTLVTLDKGSKKLEKLGVKVVANEA